MEPAIAIIVSFGLATGVVGKIKGSSFVLWFLIGAVVPPFGLLAAVLYRFESAEPRTRCPVCGNVVALHVQVCTRCGHDLEMPPELRREASAGAA